MSRTLLQIKGLNKSFGDKIIFDQADLSISEKQKIGVVGRNGAGKTTLFKMLLNQEEPDGGVIQHFNHLRLGYIPQNDPYTPDEVVIEFLERFTGKPEWECAKVASKFELKNYLSKQIGELSGGYQMRVKLAATLLQEPNLLLLDEPTNYLDLQTQILLERFLLSFNGAYMVITHDREFIKKTCQETLEVENGKLNYYPKPLEEYFEYKLEQMELAKSVNQGIERKQKQLQEFVDRFGAKASKAKAAKSKEKQIARLGNEKIEIAHSLSNIKMHIPEIEQKKGVILSIADLTIGYPDRVIASKINLDIERGDKVAILGENGQGKSTLLKTLAGTLPKISGNLEWKNNPKISYYHQHVQQDIKPNETIREYINRKVNPSITEQEILRMLSNFFFKKTELDKSTSVLSGGEKARLCLAAMFLSKSDVYLLDEPTNHLDFETVEVMAKALKKFNGTVVIISHDRTFVSIIAEKIIEVKNGTIKPYGGDYNYYVWVLEQTSNKESELIKQIETIKPLKPKGSGRELYELQKQLNKLQRQIDKLQAQKTENNISKEELIKIEQIENEWLETQEKIDALK